ncbi:MAG: prephenate dehydrogenase/arogenate dehydrogenase family protein [Chromatiaceae bacterium]|nr:prephenate dehydrogenase/arogenate dehydrogenase family protein [Gammaproteobacteria bacterium]MCP5427985.1 prephenate dehydrogenase/arogenate dehydrogenase family protein [Chromatiaceae bacterium]MCB1860822.1 prephenate dehydrogenase/arogenate dehydrogenase family protein [Gammaproteobacteria bacterium]MCB1872626.1 prephenate dehydrogenase/arogenate dehydrogenase family protein [Gammaproteobacteria bacterium]MCB1881018.1 prephenate dehydrogenase/arogenate dehydrogenase family protein [Gamma
MDELEKLRAALSELDVKLLELVAQRQQIVASIGRVKSAAGRGTRDYAREKEVLQLARRTAARVGLDEAVGADIFRLLIRASLAAQEQDKVATFGIGSGKRALVIGGAGQMGQWFVRFLASQGYQVEVCDPAGGVTDYASYTELGQTGLDQDLIVVTAPIAETAKILSQLARRRPQGLIFDICSLKGPLLEALSELKSAGCQVASVHPMFGPDTELLSGRNLVLVDLGVAAATEAVRALFDSTMVDQVSMSLEEHDKAMAYVLGLSHAISIAFFKALLDSGEDAITLAKLSSPTFDAQLDVASRVSRENPYLYFEVQSLNSHSPRALVALLNAVTQVAARVLDKDESGFVELMEQGKTFLAGRPRNRP